jgi:hypothetical protein
MREELTLYTQCVCRRKLVIAKWQWILCTYMLQKKVTDAHIMWFYQNFGTDLNQV